VLEALARSGGEQGISELARATGLPYATIHRLAATLVARGYLRQDPRSRKYVLGARLVKLGASAGRLLGTWVRPYLQELVELTGETANVAVLEGGSVMYVDQVPAHRMVRMFTEVGNRVPAHSTAVGKVLLAHQPRPVVERILEHNGLPAATANTITDSERFLAELDRVTEQGYAVDMEEQEEGVCCLAVPIVPLVGWVASMSVSGPVSRVAPAQDRIVEQILRVAGDLATSMAANSEA
ncbi:MAG: helix-turn-helix domain-containing protein, partial [Nitriliruptorales bacterium]|nr:helix-turn-helix domain-containing protein [Nitriliruptorales bacterium]